MGYLGNGKGEVILFEPSTQEHISGRTIFDPITALAPAADCRTYAIGYVEEHRRVALKLTIPQVSEWIYIDRNSAAAIYHSAHVDDIPWTFAYYLSGMACIFLEAKIGYVGNTIFEWRLAGMECRQTTWQGIPTGDQSAKKIGFELFGP